MDWGKAAQGLGKVIGAGGGNKQQSSSSTPLKMSKQDDSGSEEKASEAADYWASPKSYKRGGKVKKTGYAKVHKGEKVLTKKQAKRGRK